jgi:hypothetical protein
MEKFLRYFVIIFIVAWAANGYFAVQGKTLNMIVFMFQSGAGLVFFTLAGYEIVEAFRPRRHD